MSKRPPAFPPDVAEALQRPEGVVSFRYTFSAELDDEPMEMDRLLMETPYADVLVALVLDTKHNLRFIRTGNRAEGARVAMVNVGRLVGHERHWDVNLIWSPEEMRVRVRPQHEQVGWLEGRFPR